ncbi:MAG: phosphatidylserine decarboxylase [Kiritimatiellae bacterium]|nr:phosphatidylserine decarboxylase [Kiritimatiellia bacterium]MDW8458162.1 phosphatidylserine decarboxylase [Verrucomicrobiota bacterium]
MKVARGFWSHVLVVLAVAVVLSAIARHAGYSVAAWALLASGGLAIAFLAYFFRDPDRPVVEDSRAVVSGADGWVRSVERFREDKYLKTDCVRISTFLTPFDVHVNRAPIAGSIAALDYTPGKHLFTIQEAASDVNEHSSIVIVGRRTRCLVKQIVGPIVRRVVYWLTVGQSVEAGERIGMMKFGSRLDVYLPEEDVEVLVKPGDRVLAGITAIARIRKGDST